MTGKREDEDYHQLAKGSIQQQEEEREVEEEGEGRDVVVMGVNGDWPIICK